MNEQNLIPITKKTARALGRKGGLACKNNPNHKLGCRIRELKKKGLKKEDAKILYDMMVSGDVLNLDILIGLKSLKSDLKYDKDKLQWYKTMIDLSKQIHGEKRKLDITGGVDHRVVNINIIPYEDDNKLADKSEAAVSTEVLE